MEMEWNEAGSLVGLSVPENRDLQPHPAERVLLALPTVSRGFRRPAARVRGLTLSLDLLREQPSHVRRIIVLLTFLTTLPLSLGTERAHCTHYALSYRMYWMLKHALHVQH